MVICIVALVVLGFLSIFSAKYRSWFREALGCVTRMATLRPCQTGFDDKVKAKVTEKLMARHMGLAKFTHKHFKAISWVFMIAFFASLIYTGYTVYNLAVFGTCDPVGGNCVFNPGGNPNRVVCPFENMEPKTGVPTIGNFLDIESATITGKPLVYFLGTTWCPHCSWELPIFNEMTARFSGYIDVKVVEIDQQQNQTDMEIFNHYSPDGHIPLLILGGKYFRIGSGESLGQEAEGQVLTALLCKITDSPATVASCQDQTIKALIAGI